MIAILSPAKNMEPAALPGLKMTAPRFSDKTERLASLLREKSPWQLESLMKINPDLAMKAFSYFQDSAPDKKSPALLSYRGLAYQHLNAGDFSIEDFSFAQTHLRLFSAFYGPLRPADAIAPYRLEMQCRLRIDGGSLYRFWGDTFYRDVTTHGPVINLASAEYAKTVQPFLRPGDDFITCRFLVQKRGKYVCLPTAAKMARGAMARWMVRNRAENPDVLKEFHENGFVFSEALSTETNFTFLCETC